MAAVQVEFPFSGASKGRAVFDAAPISSDSGALLLRQVDRRLGLLDSLAAALPDPRDPRYVEHTLVELLDRVARVFMPRRETLWSAPPLAEGDSRPRLGRVLPVVAPMSRAA